MEPRPGDASRIVAEYRRLVMLGKLRLPLAEARRLVGPDCAYHLYFRHSRAARARSDSAKPGSKTPSTRIE